MIVQFIRNNYTIPNIYRQYEDFYYDDFIKKINSERTDFNVKYVQIDYLDRGVRSWKEFSRCIVRKFPNIEALAFEQNYYYCTEDDWDSAETFFVNTGLKYLQIDWFQEYEGKIFNNRKHKAHYHILTFTDE